MAQLDNRIIEVDLTIDGKKNTYKNLYIQAIGRKFGSTSLGQCDLTILNLKRDVREFILQETSRTLQSSRSKVQVALRVGRESYGAALLYTGEVFRSVAAPRPDVGVSLKCLTGFSNKNVFVTRSREQETKLSELARSVATDAQAGLSFEIEDKFIRSYSYSGSAQSQIDYFSEIANANVYIDNSVMYVIDAGKPRKEAPIKILNASTGLLIASGTLVGMRCQFLYDPLVTVNSKIQLKSVINPALDGLYYTYKVAFNVTNRDTPFYLDCECRAVQ